MFAWSALQRIYRSQEHIDVVFEDLIRHTPLADQDRALAFELIYGVLRHAITLDWRLDHLSRKPLARLPLTVATTLRLAAYQLLYLDGIPDSAAVNEAVLLIRRQKGHDWGGLVNAILRNLLRQPAPALPDIHTHPQQFLSLTYACPEWMVTRWINSLGFAQAETLCQKTMEIPPVTLRTNTLRVSREGLLQRLADESIPARETPVSPVGILLERSGNPANLSVLQEGLCYIEDEAAQLIPLILDPQPGERILDACAAPGGKTTHLAQVMQNQGLLTALDRKADRLTLLRENCARLGVSIVDPIQGDLLDPQPSFRHPPQKISHERPNSLKKEYDRILVDAPCSALGVLRRHPEGKLFKDSSVIRRSAQTQRQILESVCGLLRPGGILVYSACTVEPEETTDILADFCQNHPEFHQDPVTPWLPATGQSLIQQEGYLCTISPSFSMDGFFAGRLRKSD